MRWSKDSRTKVIPLAILTMVATLALFAAPQEKHLSVYSTAANYPLPIVQRRGHDYVGLLELLEPLGAVSAKSDGKRWRLHYNNILGEFTEGQSHARIQGHDADLIGKFVMENGRGLVPVAGLDSLLPRFLGGPANLHQDSYRLFIGSVATHFTASVSPQDPSRLLFQFTAPVNPTVATEHGKVRMIFTHEPVIAPASPTLTFESKTIPEATYSEGNGAAEIIVNTTIPLIASFSADGKTITLSPPKQAEPTANVTPGAPPQKASPPATSATNSPPAPRRIFAVVDASHGGDDHGEALSATLAEKDVNVAFARHLRQELEIRGIATIVLRDSDANISLDDRAAFTNNARAAIYIAVHAASSGHGVRLYTAMLPYGGEEDKGPFRSWPTAQQGSIVMSQEAAASVAGELKKQQVAVRMLTAPLRPLNNVEIVAIAVEIAPSDTDVSQLASQDYQQQTSSAVAAGIANIRAQLVAAQ